VYDFLLDVLGIDSFDNKGADLVSSGNFGRKYCNAFWNGSQMVFGKGDNRIFNDFAGSLDVSAHELAHAITDRTCRLAYKNQSGALNESFSDVIGVCCEQWYQGQLPSEADWLIGEEIMGPEVTAKSLRTFRNEPAYINDPYLGTDKQPKHMKDYLKLPLDQDQGGVHTNSGIPNHAFYLLSQALAPEPSYGKALRIWYYAHVRLWFFQGFKDMARGTLKAARKLYDKETEAIVRECWEKVGVL
jgi:Zn-dependent metalloprotease